jgi:outer membrane protein
MSFSTRAGMAALAVFAGSAAGPEQQQQQQQQAPAKVVYVQTEMLMDNAPGKQAAESTYSKEITAFQQQMKKLQDSLNVLIEKYTADESKLTPAQKETREKAINDFQVDAQAKQIEAQGKVERRKQDLMIPMQDAVKSVLDEMREADGYALILDASAVIAGDKNLDVTDKAVIRLRAKANTTVRRSGGQ